jgi:hypothetical protein
MTRVHLSLLDASPAKVALLARGRVAGEFLELPDDDFKAACAPFIQRGLGDRLAAFLRRFSFSRAGGCGCARRQAWLNTAGCRVVAWLKKRGFDKPASRA